MEVNRWMSEIKRKHSAKISQRIPRLYFKRILIPVDGSENAKRAVRIAVAIAKKYQAHLYVLHVIPTIIYESSSIGVGDYYKIARRDAKEIVGEAVSLGRSHGVTVTGHIINLRASIVEAIADYAATKKVDLIVIGTRGRSGFKKLLLGSVTSGIVNHTHCEVLVVR
jgi:nucleotide-binding universal stress UspA family protein